MILLTGASGYIGSALYKRFQALNPADEVVGCFHSFPLFPELRHLDLTDQRSVNDRVSECAPEWIVHVAAVPSQTGFDENRAHADAVNRQGTEYLVDAANRVGAKVLYISSEAAEDGSAYGESKRFGEEVLARRCNNGWMVLRPGTTYGLSPNLTHPRPFNRLLHAVRENKSITLDNTEIYSVTWLRHLLEVSEGLMQRPQWNRIIPVVLNKGATRFEMAQEILKDTNVLVSALGGARRDLRRLSEQVLLELNLPTYSFEEALTSMREDLMHALNTEDASGLASRA